MEILAAIILTLLSVGMLYSLGAIKELTTEMKYLNEWYDNIRDEQLDLSDELYEIKEKIKKK